jgi:SAM-dependent methyltransferase
MDNSKKLDLGCGRAKREGFVGVDSLDLPGVDVCHDLNCFPYPFDDDQIDEVWMDQVLEHLSEPVKVMEEIHRICRNSAKVTVGVPYFRSHYAVIDPTHRNFFSAQWFAYFDPQHCFCDRYQYSGARFSVDRVVFDREFKDGRMGALHRLLVKIAEARTEFYEARLSHLLPLNSLTFYLTVLK